MRVRPTELGLKGILLLAALELAFLATSYSNLFFLLIAFCCVLGVLGLWWAIGNVRGIRVSVEAVPMAAAEAPRTVQLRIAIAGRRRFDLAVATRLGDRSAELVHLVHVAGDAVVEAQLPGLPRGVLELPQLEVRSRFPFGLFAVTRTLPAAAEVVTHPRLREAHGDAAAASEGDALLARAGARSVSVAGLRPFRTGDAAVDVHWKATARRGQPIVKERERDADEAIEVVLDRRCAPVDLEQALETVTALLFAAATAGRPFLLRSQGFTADLGVHRGDRDGVLRWLAGAAPLPVTAPAPVGAASALRLPAARAAEVAHG